MTKNFDPRCYELALVFLDSPVTDLLVRELAQCIQNSIEDWLSFEKQNVEDAIAKAKAAP